MYLSTRRGSWILSRVGPKGLPIDIANARRFRAYLFKYLPYSIKCSLAEKRIMAKFDHGAYGLKPRHRILAQHPTLCDDLPNRILCGSVIVKPNIKHFTAHGVEFEDGTQADDIDVVIFATGYKFGFPFLDKDVLNVERNTVELYKYVFPPRLEKPSLAVIGCTQPIGAINPISEMQSRWVAQVFKVCACLQ